jgi:methylated-DNA-[protein]-cysteine S-methyltransferase
MTPTTTPTPSPAFLESFASAAVAEGLVDAVYSHVDTHLGRLVLVQSSEGICRIGFPEEDERRLLAKVAGTIGPRVVASDTETERARDMLTAYVEGAGVRLDLPVDLAMVRSAFQRDVLIALQEVGRGDVATYRDIATRIGRPKAVRATGTALGRNPIPILVPCHRVIPSTGGIGQYGGGAARKRALLELEGALPA